jgi:large conductance mechanosensitive channel
MNGFFKFVVRGNVVGLAVGVVIGAAFSSLVAAFVKAFLSPWLDVIGRAGGQFDDKVFHVGKTEFPYGSFINALIAFVLTAGVIYFLVVLPVNKLAEELNPHHDLARAKRACPDCLQQIPAIARRCSYCTSHVDPITDEDSLALVEEKAGEISLSGPVSFKMPAGQAAEEPVPAGAKE